MTAPMACNSPVREPQKVVSKNMEEGTASGARSTNDNRVTDQPNRCFNVSNAEPQRLSGVLEYTMFAGPPNFEDVQKGDAPEPAYVLRLKNSICISDEEGFADPSRMFDRVQVVPGRVGQDLRGFVGQSVSLELYDQMAAFNGHHHQPLVAWVSSVSSAPPAPKETTFRDDPIGDYGTPATTIRAFYAALQAGQGSVAATMIVPEKRLSGPFSAASLTRFYSNMKSPVELLNVSRMGAATYLVRYRYAVTHSVCSGRAIVETTELQGRDYIKRIRALDGC